MVNMPKSTARSRMKNFMKLMYPTIFLSIMNIIKRTVALRKKESNILRTKVLEVMWTFKSPYRATG